MTDMVEKLARAIAVNLGVDPDMPHFTLSEAQLLGWQQFEGTAKDALEALREPDKAMIAAAENTKYDPTGWPCDHAVRGYEAMIDQARGQ
jgi:hypothetical protein